MEIEVIKERFDIIAKKYDEQRRFFIPCFDDFYKTSLSILWEIKNDFQSVLDLGAGTGLLTQYLFERFPEATYTLVDVAEQMMGVARERFSLSRNFNYLIADYSLNLPDDKFDLIASALSIHHLAEQSKARLYENVYNSLPLGGYFINLDQFNATSQLVNEAYNNWWYRQIELSEDLKKERELWLKRRELDRENTMQETVDMLKRVGFGRVECIYSYMKFGVVLAIKG